MFAIPLSGWLYNSAAGFPLQWFHLVNLPALAAADPALKAAARQAHQTGVIALIVVVTLHAAGALKHHFVDRDRTLTAMLPRARGHR
jgi:cytochrome b561